MTNILVLFSTLIFGLESFSFCLDSTLVIFLKFLLLRRNPRDYGFILFPFKFPLLPCHILTQHSKTPPCLGSSQDSHLQQVSNQFLFLFHLFNPQNYFCHYLWTQVIYKGSTRFLLSFDPKPTPLTSPQYPQPRSIKIHLSSVQIFQNLPSASLDQKCHFR